MTRRERVKEQREKYRLSSTEYKISLMIAKVLVLFLVIFAYAGRASLIALFKTKRWLFRFSIVILIGTFSLQGLTKFADAPKADAVYLGEVQGQAEYAGENEIDAYVRTIFGKDADIAIAVHKGECHPSNRTYPKCGPFVTEREYSCGIFQINLRAHWKKVPVGNTFEEKCDFLEDPFNNTLVAYKIFKDSNWYPWAAYTGGNYLKYL